MLKVTIAWVILLSILYSALAVVRHNNFQSGAFDLGLYDQAVWQFSQFSNPYNTIKERFIFGDHLVLTLPLLSPLFYIWNDVRILLIFQAVWISFSTIAIYHLSKLRGISSVGSLLLSVIYSLFYGIQFAAYFDFHPVVIGVGLLAWLVYFFEAKKKKLFLLFLALFLLTQENMGVGLAGVGIIYFFYKKYRKAGIYFIVGGLIASFLALKIVAMNSQGIYQYSPQIDNDLGLMISRFFDTGDKQLVWLYSFGWFSALPLLSIGSIVAVVLDLTQYFVFAHSFGHMTTPFLHHRAILAIFLLLGTLNALEFLKKRKINTTVVIGIMLCIALAQQYLYHFPLNRLVKKDYWKSEQWTADNRSLLPFVPDNASVVAQHNMVPHLSHRKEIYIAWPRQKDMEKSVCGTKSCWFLEFAGKPEYLVVNLDQTQWVTHLLETPENFKSAVSNMEKSGRIVLTKEVGSAKLYTIKY